MEKNVEISILLDFYGQLLTDTQRVAIREHYDEDQSFAEIGDRMGTSRQAVHDAVKKGEIALYDYEKKLGTMKRYLAFDKNISELEGKIKSSNKDEILKAISRLKSIWDNE